jgi:hypothetical protein
MPMPPGYTYYGNPGAIPYYGGYAPPPGMSGQPAPGAYGSPATMPYAPQMTREQELDFLKSQAEMIRGQLEQIDARMRELEAEE